MPRDDASVRRDYWRAQMGEAYAFMLAIRGYPVEECGQGVVSLPAAAQEAGVEVAFAIRPHVLGLPRLYFLREGLVPGFLAAAREMNERGWVPKVEDGYRTPEMQRHLARQPYTFDVVLKRLRWECEGGDPPADLLSRRLAALIAASPKEGTHISASAMDVSVLHRETRREIDRGGPYIELSELTPMASPFISPEARGNRDAITEIMRRHGFVTYPWEFWHYNAGDAYAELINRTGRPARYGAVHVSLPDGSVTPVENPHEPLNSPAKMAELLREALDRRPA